jgi:Tol biopolymer transport system component
MSGVAEQIAFVSDRNDRPDIYMTNANGSDPINLTNDYSHNRTPAWSPDGTRIAFSSDRAEYGKIYDMNADGSNPVRLTDNLAVGVSPAWRPLRATPAPMATETPGV